MLKKEKNNFERKIKTRVFSAIRPTGPLHLGNYLGGLKAYLELQNRSEFDCIYAVADLHGLASPFEKHTFNKNIKELVLEYLACGLDPQKCHLIIQSEIPQHSELAYLFAAIFPLSRLEQLPTFKEKKKEQPKDINVGLLYYPILMAADILLYKADIVPVGKDQLPHLEITREIARFFNKRFGKTFPEPKDYLAKGSYVPSLLGEGKMSKSKEGSFISLIDDQKTIEKKLAKVPTDIGKGKEVPKKGGVAVLLTLLELFEGKEEREIYEKQYLSSGIKYQNLKKRLAEAIYKEIKPIQLKRTRLLKESKLIEKVLVEGREYATSIAEKTLKEAKEKMGLNFNLRD